MIVLTQARVARHRLPLDAVAGLPGVSRVDLTPPPIAGEERGDVAVVTFTTAPDCEPPGVDLIRTELERMGATVREVREVRLPMTRELADQDRPPAERARLQLEAARLSMNVVLGHVADYVELAPDTSAEDRQIAALASNAIAAAFGPLSAIANALLAHLDRLDDHAHPTPRRTS